MHSTCVEVATLYSWDPQLSIVMYSLFYNVSQYWHLLHVITIVPVINIAGGCILSAQQSTVVYHYHQLLWCMITIVYMCVCDTHVFLHK